MNSTSLSNTAVITTNKHEYPVQESGNSEGVPYACFKALYRGNNSSGLFIQPATDSSRENQTRSPVKDFSSRNSARAVDPLLSIKIGRDTGSTSQQWRCSSEQSVDDESPGRNNPVALNSSDNPVEDYDATFFRTGAVSNIEEKIFRDHGPAQSFGGSPRFRDARLVEIANQFEDGSHAITLKLAQLLVDKKQLLQSTNTGSSRDRPAQNTVSLLAAADASLNAFDYGCSDLLKKLEKVCTLIDRIPVEQTGEPGVHFQRPEQARQDEEMPFFLPLCPHYDRRCLVRFSCCYDYYPCHRCHNLDDKCRNTSAKACNATHIKCDVCYVTQEINENSQHCSACQIRFSEYFCAKCKHFTSKRKNPHHCDKCGICRVQSDKSFHCDVCNVCIDEKLKVKHICWPDSGHEVCCICLEDAFSGAQILPCTHKIHSGCAEAAILSGGAKCLFCVNDNHMESYASNALFRRPASLCLA